MSQQIKLKKVIVYYDEGDHYGIVTYDADEALEHPYLAGKLMPLVPDQAKLITSKIIKESLFNKIGDAKIIAEVGSKGAMIIRLKSSHRIEKIIVEPDDVVVDIYFDDESLIYAFYNQTRREVITVTVRDVLDDEGIIKKLKEAPEDLQWRQYFVRRAMLSIEAINSNSIGKDTLNVKEASKLLGVAEKTIRNWTSGDKIPYKKSGRRVTYDRKEILVARDEGVLGKKRFRGKYRS